MTRYFDKMG